jgi:hypothetical protein
MVGLNQPEVWATLNRRYRSKNWGGSGVKYGIGGRRTGNKCADYQLFNRTFYKLKYIFIIIKMRVSLYGRFLAYEDALLRVSTQQENLCHEKKDG